jgi:hypothetical protein
MTVPQRHVGAEARLSASRHLYCGLLDTAEPERKEQTERIGR